MEYVGRQGAYCVSNEGEIRHDDAGNNLSVSVFIKAVIAITMSPKFTLSIFIREIIKWS